MPLTDAEIDEKFADLFAEAIAAFRVHPEFVVRMAEAAAERLHPERWAQAIAPALAKPQPLSTINSPEARQRAREFSTERTARKNAEIREQVANAKERKEGARRQRDSEIVAMRATGATIPQLVKVFSMSHSGIRHVLAREIPN